MLAEPESKQRVSPLLVLVLLVLTARSVSSGEDGAGPASDSGELHAASTSDTLESLLDQTITGRRDRMRQLHSGIRTVLERLTEQRTPKTDASREPSEPLPVLPRDESATPESLPPPEPPVSAPEDKQPMLPMATLVTDRPIDQLAAADNLFGAGDIRHALDLYRQLQAVELPEAEHRWIRYQIASCQRRLGEIGAATKEYRELANDGVTDEISENARWFIEMISQRNSLSSHLENLAITLEIMENEVHNEFPP